MQQEQPISRRIFRYVPWAIIVLLVIIVIFLIASIIISANAAKYSEYLVGKANDYCQRNLLVELSEFIEPDDYDPSWDSLANCSEFAVRAHSDYPKTLIDCDSISISDVEFDECADPRFSQVIEQYLDLPAIARLRELYTPVRAVEAWFTSAFANDIESLKESTCTESHAAVEEVVAGFGSLSTSGAIVDASGLIYTMVTDSVDSATVMVTGNIKVSVLGQEVEQPMEGVTVPLIKEGKSWKVCGF